MGKCPPNLHVFLLTGRQHMTGRRDGRIQCGISSNAGVNWWGVCSNPVTARASCGDE